MYTLFNITMCKEIAEQLCKVALAFKTTQAYTFVCYSNGQILNTIFYWSQETTNIVKGNR